MSLVTNEMLESLKGVDKISISYIQRNFGVGYNLAYKIFKELIDSNYIDSDGNIKKQKEPEIKLIFLDVDGVLNCSSTKDRCGRYVGIDSEKAVLLKKLVEKTNARIILISTWKEWWYKEPHLKDKQDILANYLDNKFAEQGLKISDKADDYHSFGRGDGILKYLRKLGKLGINVEKFVIFDDETFDYKPMKLTRYLVRTSYDKKGLEDKHIKKALEILNPNESNN